METLAVPTKLCIELQWHLWISSSVPLLLLSWRKQPGKTCVYLKPSISHNPRVQSSVVKRGVQVITTNPKKKKLTSFLFSVGDRLLFWKGLQVHSRIQTPLEDSSTVGCVRVLNCDFIIYYYFTQRLEVASLVGGVLGFHTHRLLVTFDYYLCLFFPDLPEM